MQRQEFFRSLLLSWGSCRGAGSNFLPTSQIFPETDRCHGGLFCLSPMPSGNG